MASDWEKVLPEKLSPSRAKSFMQCPRLFYYTTVCKVSTPPTFATAKGTLCHHVFERVFDHPRQDRTLETALSYVEPAWRMMTNPLVSLDDLQEESPEYALRSAAGVHRAAVKPGSSQEARLVHDADATHKAVLGESDQATLLVEARTSVTGWFSMEDPTKFDPYEREMYVSAALAGVPAHGFIDRLDRTFDAQGSSVYWVSDYKTGKPPSPRFQDEAFFQLEVYALLVREILGAAPHQLRLVYVREGRRDAILRRQVTDATLRRTQSKLSSVWKSIREAARTGEWPTRKQVLCDWCYFKDVCPAWNPELEGLLPEELELRLAMPR